MKKLVSLLLALALLLTLASCGGGGENAAEGETKTESAPMVTEALTDEKLPEAESSSPETTGASEEESESAPLEDTTGPEPEASEPEEESEETSFSLDDITLPEGVFETVVTDNEGTEWVVGSSQLFGGTPEPIPEETEAEETTASDTEKAPAEPETTAPATETEEPETEPEEPETEPDEDATLPTTYPTVLMYHCVNDVPNTVNTLLFVRPSELEKQLQLLCELDIDTLFADEFGPVHKNSVILTFDDGYEDNYTYMFPLIQKYNIKVTVYIIAYMIDSPGYLTTQQIKEMSESGLVQFGSHTLDHPSLTKLSPEEIRQQFQGASWIIYTKTGKTVTTVAYPSGEYNETVMDIAREYYKFAYTTDATYYWGQDDMMLPRYAILRDTTIDGFRAFVE